MAEAVSVLVGKEITRILGENKFGHTYVPKRSYADWDLELTQMDKLNVDIVSGILSSDIQVRGSVTPGGDLGLVYQVYVDIGIRKRFGDSEQRPKGELDVSEIDKLVLLVQDVHEYFLQENNRRLVNYDSASWEETMIKAVAIREHLKSFNQFTGIIRLLYSVSR